MAKRKSTNRKTLIYIASINLLQLKDNLSSYLICEETLNFLPYNIILSYKL